MSTERLLLSEKYKAFLRCDAPVEFLEGTTAAGKTTVGLFKFMLKVAESPKKLHIIAAKDTGTAEKNIINKDLGIVDDFGVLAEYNGNGTKDDKIPHILFHTSQGDKIVYVMGYGDKKKWQKALGGQYGCLYIDEVNTADIDFVREAAMRCDYFMATLNPDDPNLDVYREYINCSRPLPEWEEETPQEIRNELKEEPKPGWVHWFFSFVHNLGLPKEKIDKIIANTPKGTKIWKNKILGLRGKATGLVFSNFDRVHHVKSKEWAKQFVQSPDEPRKKEFFMYFSAAVDTSYSQKSPDTIAMSFLGITNKGRCIVLAEKCITMPHWKYRLPHPIRFRIWLIFWTETRKNGACQEMLSWIMQIRQPCRSGINISAGTDASIRLITHGSRWRSLTASTHSWDGWHMTIARK